MANMSKVGKYETTIKKSGEDVAVTYFETVVFERTGNCLTLRHGGWKTQSTTRRINQSCAQFKVTGYAFLKNRVMYFDRFNGENPVEITKEGIVIPLH